MQDLVTGEGGEVRLGAIEPTLSARLPQLIATYSRAKPKVHLFLESGSTSSISQRVHAGELDFGLCGPPNAQLNLVFEPLFNEKLTLLLPATNPLARLPRVRISDLTEQNLLLSGPSCVYRELLERDFLTRGVNICNQIEASEVETLKLLVQQGIGVAIVPSISVITPPNGTVTRSIHGIKLGVTIGIVRRGDDFAQGQAYGHFLKMIRQSLLKS